jgi:hypothetical protein
VSAIGEAVRASGRRLPGWWLDALVHQLKQEGPDRVLLHLSRLCERCQDPEADKKLRYLATRRELMGVTDLSASWLAHWLGHGGERKPAHVNPMLARHSAVCNERWTEAWQEAQNHSQQQHTLGRHSQATPRLTQLVVSTLLLLLRFRPPTSPSAISSSRPKAALSSSPPATLPGSSRPSLSHPWKRIPACRPKPVAKN